jgi:N-acetylglucosaminyldiphosphoundecaprenol N-acetyl-beta-D-mannosaminyltransferase
VNLMEMAIDAVTEREALERVFTALEREEGGLVLTPNLQLLRAFHRSEEVRRAFDGADLVLADGMPLLWASRLQDTPLPERIAGSALIWSMTAESARRQRSIFLLGGDPGVAERAAALMHRRMPELTIAGTAAPRVSAADTSQLDRVRALLREHRPDIVYLGLPFEKALVAFEACRDASPSSWFVEVGVSLSFVTGDVRRAPAWIQRRGLEWAWRLSQEPGRLWRRYLVEGMPFMLELLGSALRRRLSGAVRSHVAIFPARLGAARGLRIPTKE